MQSYNFYLEPSREAKSKNNFAFYIVILTFAFCILHLAKARVAFGQQPLIAALEWEAGTSVPAGYAGKALPVAGSTVRLALFLQPGVKEENVSVEWRLNGSRVAAPDPFRAEVLLTRDLPNGHALEARVRGRRNNVVETIALTLPVVTPEVRLHAVSARGAPDPYAAGESARLGAGGSATLVARPYFFPSESPVVQWFANNEPITGQTRQPEFLTIETPANQRQPLERLVRATARDRRFAGVTAEKEIRVEIR